MAFAEKIVGAFCAATITCLPGWETLVTEVGGRSRLTFALAREKELGRRLWTLDGQASQLTNWPTDGLID
jgi:hypothetical protein